MAKLTDLPDEILALIFRNFLSSSLTNQSILCEWPTQLPRDNAETQNRANLLQLALVSKALHARAMPLLFEQLFYYQDTHRIVKTEDSLRAALRYAPYILYLDVHMELEGGDLSPRIKQLLSQSTRVKHLKSAPWNAYETSGKAYSSLFGFARKCRIQSLYIEMVNDRGAPPVVLDQLLIIDSLVGLQIQLSNGVREDPSNKMRNLKILKIDGSGDPAAEALCLSLACANTLVDATIELAPQPLSIRLFGLENWHGLEALTIRMHGDLDLYGQVAMSRLPSLRTLTIIPEESEAIPYDAILPGLPAGITMLVLQCLNLPELRMLLEAIQRGTLPPGLKYLILDLESISDDCIYVNTSEEVEELLELAETALRVLDERGLKYEPENLIKILNDSFILEDVVEDIVEDVVEDPEDGLEDMVEDLIEELEEEPEGVLEDAPVTT